MGILLTVVVAHGGGRIRRVPIGRWFASARPVFHLMNRGETGDLAQAVDYPRDVRPPGGADWGRWPSAVPCVKVARGKPAYGAKKWIPGPERTAARFHSAHAGACQVRHAACKETDGRLKKRPAFYLPTSSSHWRGSSSRHASAQAGRRQGKSGSNTV